MAELAASDVYPVLRRFLVETGLQRTLKAFDKETAPEDEEAAPSKQKRKLAKKLASCEILAAVQSWLEAGAPAAPAAVEAAVVEAAAPAAPPTPRKRAKSDASEASKTRKRKKSVVLEEVAEEEPPKKKKRNASADLSEAVEAKVETPAAAPAAKTDKQKNQKTPGKPFSRIDHDKWVKVAAQQDKRLLDNTHEATGGDSWGDQASVDLLKVKGKGFRKEMQKKKRASWRGGGEINQATHSIAFADSDDE